MKQFQEKLPIIWALAIIPFLVGVELLSSPAALAAQPISTLEERVQQMEEELQVLRRELTRVREEEKNLQGG